MNSNNDLPGLFNEAADIVDTEFFAPSPLDMIDGLVSQHRAMRQKIERVAATMNGPDLEGALHYFAEHAAKNDRHISASTIEKMFDINGALAHLHAAYWSKAMHLTDVLDLMPQKRRSEWHQQILNPLGCKERYSDKWEIEPIPEFTDETVRSTLKGLLLQREQFFAERVDGMFRGLSGEHVTNQPQGFGKRMIVARVLNEWGSVDYTRAGLINDLRAVIARFMGRDEPKHNSSEPLITRLKGCWGEWVEADGGAIKIRLYKKGTAHLEIHPDIAWRLNQILASLYPLAIPPEFRSKPKKRVRDFKPLRKPLPFAVLAALSGMDEATTTLPQEQRTGWRDNGLRALPKTRRFRFDVSKDAQREAECVLESIGGVKQPEGHWLFDYEPGDVIGEIVVSGCIPDHRSHQFYPTPSNLAEIAITLAGVEPGHTVLEPSAGQGGLADLLPPEQQTTCVELSSLHCKVLEAKGHTVVEGDFLPWAEGRWKDGVRFDRVVMNPPFSEGRWQAHLEHAAQLVADGGRLVAILPSGARNSATLPGFSMAWHGPYENQFVGASVSVVILVADK